MIKLIFLPYRNFVYYILVISGLPFIFVLTKDMGWDNRLGELSYPIYIVHMFIYYVVLIIFPQVIGMGAIVAVCSIFASLLLNRFIARPV